MAPEKSTPAEIRRRRRDRRHGCWDHLVVAPLWLAYAANLGTLLRTCDAVGACMAVPRTPHYRDALARGDTLPQRSCVHWVGPDAPPGCPGSGRRARGWSPSSSPTARRGWATSAPARGRTVVLLGHEHHGVPEDILAAVDEVVEIAMVGRGASLNVAVAGSLVLYRLAGLS